MAQVASIFVITSEVTATDNPLSDICARLEDKGFNVVLRRLEGTSLKGLPKQNPAAILLYFPNSDNAPIVKLTAKLREAYSAETVPIIATLPAKLNYDLTGLFDSTLFMPAHPAQVVNRLTALLRLRDIQIEIQMRSETLSEQSHAALPQAPTPHTDPLRILFIGKATPEFMAIMNAFTKKHVNVVAAFTSFTAFDYLHEQSFDAVVLNALQGNEPAFTITSTMRRNSKLFHVPTLILVDGKTFTDASQAYEKGANDILQAGAPLEEISGRILELANYHSAHEQLKARFSTLGDAECMDLETGLFNGRFFEAHSARHMAASLKTGRPLTMAVFTTKFAANGDIPPTALASACKQIGGMIKSLIRMQDCAARVSTTQFAILFPGESEQTVRTVTQRIQDIIDCTAFECFDSPFKVVLDVTVKQLAPRLTASPAANSQQAS